MVCQSFEIRITSLLSLSSSLKIVAQTIFQVFAVIAMAFDHDQPLFWSLYSSTSESFQYQFSVIVRIYLSFSVITATSITLSHSFNFIHLTPNAVLHIGLTSFSSNLIAFQFFVAMKILSSQDVDFTQVNSSFSFTQSTFNQFERIFLSSEISNFLTVPRFVTKNKYFPFSSVISIIAATSSSF